MGKIRHLRLLVFLCADCAGVQRLKEQSAHLVEIPPNAETTLAPCRPRAREMSRENFCSHRSRLKLSKKAFWWPVYPGALEIPPSGESIFRKNPSRSDSGLLSGSFCIGNPIQNGRGRRQKSRKFRFPFVETAFRFPSTIHNESLHQKSGNCINLVVMLIAVSVSGLLTNPELAEVETGPCFQLNIQI